MNNQVHSSKDVTPYANSSFLNTWKGLTFSNEYKKKKSKRHKAYGDDVELSATETEAISLEGNIDQSNREIGKNRKKKKKRKSLQINVESDVVSHKVRKRDKVGDTIEEVSKSKEDLEEFCIGVGEMMSLKKDDNMDLESNFESGVLDYKKKDKEKKSKDKNGNGRDHLDENILDHVESLWKERKQKKYQLKGDLGTKLPKVMAGMHGNESNAIEEDGGNIDSSEDVNLGAHARNDQRKDEKERKKRKRERHASDAGVIINEIDKKNVDNNNELDGNILENVEHSRKKRKKKHNVDLAVALKEHMDVKLCNESNLMGEHEGNECSIKIKVGRGKIEDCTVKKVKKKKSKSIENNSEGKGSERAQRVGKGVKHTNPFENFIPQGTCKRVRFSEEVEVFPLFNGPSTDNVQEEELVRGKRFSLEEDEMVKEAVLNYIDAHGLGEEGLTMVLNCKKYPELRNCWKEIGAALPWRPSVSVYYRAHVLFERDEKHSWTLEEYEFVHKFHEKHGSNWKTLAEALGKHRVHVKDTWRRIKVANRRRGKWSQEEYQTLFDLVNMDLRMKACEESKSSKHGMLRDNISWTAISEKLGTRATPMCCMKWYDQLTPPMVAEGKWLDVDDYRLVIALYVLDACCMEDVDWDNLLEHRSGDLCRKRWNQMVKHIGEYGNKSFADQVEILIERYCPDVLEAREAYNSKPIVP
ncbi:uncharacterized protein LOC110613056 [Manihot esculenta]|uniref:Myb-like domain-containing protein n=1 Tax=Manihot esculenta TaxID=3983 RepID=A0A2C9VYL4_MANES|nr:uncharacterized protein LOC110613056 [Manihot esculenta]XP_021609670.1 uncharacterized protein LOC110613056 [Manihot esculenta]XP_043811631.1 uncharacterized protein LOC110613056 [Manihot esculenta]XP_043811632.1 uncharacterized protein LOC110613056 [Manihot esculenta]XP_043811633.1 uncharacterized protein LOC110613056 [Manihot esculenta]